MDKQCFPHFQVNCPICFPTQTDGKSQPQSPPVEDTTVTPASSTVGPVAADSVPSPHEPPPLPQPTSTTDDDKGKTRKGKRIALEFRPPKRIRKTIIDCPIVQQIFRWDLNLTNKFFNSGNILAWAVEPDDPAFRHIQDYVACGQEHGYGLKVCAIIRIMANAKVLEDDVIDFKEDPDSQDKLSMMLWHGTRKGAIASILEGGLRLPRARNQMFGTGIYFADRISKSCQYSAVHGTDRLAFLFLCDVLLGNSYQSRHSIPWLTAAPAVQYAGDPRVHQYDSLTGQGKKIPDMQGNMLYDGSLWPLGKTVARLDDLFPIPVQLNFNEYVVYNENHVRPKYLVKVKFTKKPYYENNN